MSEDVEIPADITDESDIPRDHPRYEDLITRFRIERGVELGITHLQGMHAEGRGSAFDYLLGERTIPSADRAERAAAAALVLADRPVISVNGNVAALVPGEVGALANSVGAAVEINLFHRTDERVRAIEAHLHQHGIATVLGIDPDERLPGLNHARARVDSDGIYAADVVLVPLEDGDRALSLGELGKTRIVIDLNPLTRSQRAAEFPIVDNVIRAIPNMTDHANSFCDESTETLESIIDAFDPQAALDAAERTIRSGRLD